MAAKNGLRYYPEKASGTYKYRIVMDYYHPFEDKWKQVTCGSNSVTKGALDAAKPKLEQKVRRILDGFNKKKSTELTVSECLEEWRVFRKDSISSGTYNDDLHKTRQFEAVFGKWKVSKLEKEHIKDFLLGLTVSPSTLINYRSKMNLFFQFCEDERYIKESPMYRVRLPRHKETLAEKQKREDKFFTVKEMRKLLEAMEEKIKSTKRADFVEDSWRIRMMIEFQFLLGDRISENTGLRYQNIDFRKKLLRIQTQYDRESSVSNPKLKELKTKDSERIINLTKRQIEILKWFKARNETESEFVFVRQNGNVINNVTVNNYLKKFCELFPYKLESSFVSHAMRHSNVVVKKELGVDEQIIVAQGGWADTQMISRVYGRHVTPVLQERANKVMEDFTIK